MWTLAGGNLSEDDCEDGGDHFQDFDGNDEDIVPPIAQSESTDQCLEMLRRIQDMEKRIQDEDNEVKRSDPPQEDAAPGSKDLQALFEIPEDAVQFDSSKSMLGRLGRCGSPGHRTVVGSNVAAVVQFESAC